MKFLWRHEVTLHGCTALQAACIHKRPCGIHKCGPHFNTEVVKYLVSQGASVNSFNCYGITPLMGAASNANVEAMEYLLENGANLKARTIHGETALHVASLRGQVEAIRYLVEVGASVSDQTVQGFTPLHFAAGEGQLKAVKELLARGASPDFCPVDSSNPSYVPPPILMAACKGQKEVVHDLLRHPECSQEHKVDALLLLGIALAPGQSKADDCHKLWREALALRESCTSPPNLLPPIEAYGGRVELQTVSELEDITKLENLFQNLIILGRCIGRFDPTSFREQTFNFIHSLVFDDKKYTEAMLVLTKVMDMFLSGLYIY